MFLFDIDKRVKKGNIREDMKAKNTIFKIVICGVLTRNSSFFVSG
jgi:hypothetical protein